MLEIGRVTHGDHRSIRNDRSRASPFLKSRSTAWATHAIGHWADLTIGVCLTSRVCPRVTGTDGSVSVCLTTQTYSSRAEHLRQCGDSSLKPNAFACTSAACHILPGLVSACPRTGAGDGVDDRCRWPLHLHQ